MEVVVRISRVLTFSSTGAPILTLRATCALALLLPNAHGIARIFRESGTVKEGKRLAMEGVYSCQWRTDWEGLGQKPRLGELQQRGGVHAAYDASLGALGMRKYGLARIGSFM